ncbi:TIGR03067 domain-containing protein [bacterium]|nr:TIGR03067 domain-containing protein [bacterium]
MLRPTLTATVAAIAVLTARGDDADHKALQGTWVIEAATLEGRDHIDDFAGMKLVLAGDHYTVDFGKNTDKGTFVLDPTKTPKRIDIRSADGPFKGKTLPGIYELKSDTLVLCLEGDGKADKRPTKFEAPGTTRNMLLTYRREKFK